jgi:hypothetical protein
MREKKDNIFKLHRKNMRMKSFDKNEEKGGPLINKKGHYQWKYTRRSVIFYL